MGAACCKRPADNEVSGATIIKKDGKVQIESKQTYENSGDHENEKESSNSQIEKSEEKQEEIQKMQEKKNPKVEEEVNLIPSMNHLAQIDTDNIVKLENPGTDFKFQDKENSDSNSYKDLELRINSTFHFNARHGLDPDEAGPPR